MKRSPLQARHGRSSCARSARAVLTISSELASLQCSCPGIRRRKTSRHFGSTSASAPLITGKTTPTYYRSFATTDSPKLRDSNPSVVVIPGLGIFGFAKDKRDARITTEFFVNAIHVMQGANALEDADGRPAETLPQARRAEQARQFSTFHNYVALPRSEAFRIEYWALEEAKLQRMPPEREFSRKVAFIVGGGSGIGREVALGLAERGAHVVVADQNADNARAAWTDAKSRTSSDAGMAVELDLVSRGSRLGVTASRGASVSAVSTSSSTRPRSTRRRRRLSRPGRRHSKSTSRAITCSLKKRHGSSRLRRCPQRSS